MPRILLALPLLFCACCLSSCASGDSGDSGDSPRPRPRLSEPAIKVELQGFSKWQRVCEAERSHPTFQGASADIADNRLAAAWAALFNSLQGRTDMEKMRKVNRFFNRWPYREDHDVWGGEDHWATPREFMEHAGDCEDFAIVKYYALKELGLNVDAMRIAGVWNTKQRKGHAVLLVRADNADWLLDNLREGPVRREEAPEYIPQYYTNENSIWKRE